LQKITIPNIRGINVNNAATYLISFARELEMQAIISAPKIGKNIINERTVLLKFNVLPPYRSLQSAKYKHADN
jgi:hypothetical protein